MTGLPIFAMTLSVGADGLRMLESLRGVVTRVVADRPRGRLLVESSPRIQASQTAALGYDGTGTVIIVMDSGVDKTHSFFRDRAGRSRVVAEACFSSNDPSVGVTSLCPGGVATDFALDEDLATIFTAQLLNSDEAAVARLLNHPHSLISLSDAGAHLTFFNDAGFGLHLLGHWVRERGAMHLQDAVRRLTHQSADIFGLPGRGLLREGYAADLLLFDPAVVGRGRSHRVFDLPGGAPRLHTDGLGVHGVWVNGVRAVNESGPIADCGRPGKLLRDFAG
jgi:subtilisin family serine protease